MIGLGEGSESEASRLTRLLAYLQGLSTAKAVSLVAAITCALILVPMFVVPYVHSEYVLYAILFGLGLFTIRIALVNINLSQTKLGLAARHHTDLSQRVANLERYVRELDILGDELESLMVDRFHQATEKGTKVLHFANRLRGALKERLNKINALLVRPGATSSQKLEELLEADLVFPEGTLHSVLGSARIGNIPAGLWDKTFEQLRSELKAEIALARAARSKVG